MLLTRVKLVLCQTLWNESLMPNWCGGGGGAPFALADILHLIAFEIKWHWPNGGEMFVVGFFPVSQ